MVETWFLVLVGQRRYYFNRLIFETSKNRVARFRSGQLPEVEAIEGCS